MKFSRLLFFLPSICFVYMWLHLVTASMILESSLNSDIRSETFIHGVGQAMDDPWLHHSALRLYFNELSKKGAGKNIWAGSDMFARALWEQYQFVGSIEIMIAVAHAKNDPQEELRWAKLYSKVLPGDAHASELMEHAIKGHALREPLVLVGKW